MLCQKVGDFKTLTMKQAELRNTNEIVNNVSTLRNTKPEAKPRMVYVLESGNSRLARRIKNGKTNKKIATKN